MEEKKSRVEDENQSDGRRKRKKRRESGEKYIYFPERKQGKGALAGIVAYK